MLNIDTSSVLTSNPEPLIPHKRRQFLTPIPASSDFLLVLDNSALTKFKECPLSYCYYALFNREAHARNAALAFGGAVHVGLETLLKGGDDEAVTSSVNRFFELNPPPPDEYRTPANALEILRHYRQRTTLPDYSWSILSDSSGPLIERAFELPLCSVLVNRDIQLPDWPTPQFCSRIHVAWSGRIDVVANCNTLNRIVDHKTSSIDGDTFTLSFVLSSQVLGYIWAGRQLWPDLDLRAFCLNVIRFKRPTGSAPITEKGPRGGEPALKFFRAYYEYSPERMDWWFTNTVKTVADLVHCVTRSFWPARDNQCISKFGRCQYHDVCTTDNENVRAAILKSDLFKEVTWNPTDNR